MSPLLDTEDPIPRIASQARRYDVPVRAGHVVWRRFGDGPPLVLIHGGHGSWRHWLRNIEPMAQAHTLWIPDMPGYGDSAPPPQPTLSSLVNTLMDSLARLVGLDSAIDVAGFSFGGLVASHLAVQRGHVRRLALLGSAGHGTVRRPRGELLSWREAHRRGDLEAQRSVMRHNLLLHMLHDELAADETALRIHAESCLATRFHSRSISRAAGLQVVLDRYQGPTLMQWGEHDVTATPGVLLPQLLAGRANRCGDIVSGAGHWVQYEAAERVNTRLRDFLGTAGS